MSGFQTANIGVDHSLSVLIGHPSDSVAPLGILVVVLGVLNTRTVKSWLCGENGWMSGIERRRLFELLRLQGIEDSRRLRVNNFAFIIRGWNLGRDVPRGDFLGGTSGEGDHGHENDFFVFFCFSSASFFLSLFFLEWMIWLTFFMCMLPMV